MKYQVVLPYIVPEWAEACVARCRLDNVLVVDNTKTNRGVMRSHNMGLTAATETGADWLIILGAAIRFGDAGGLDFIDLLNERPGYTMVHAKDTPGWHMMAFRRDLLDFIGQWDEQFSLYGYDDVDLAIRAYKASFECNRPDWREWGGWPVDVTDAGMGHSLKIGGVKVDNAALLSYFKSKWGRLHGGEWHEYWDRPFKNRPMNYWPPKRFDDKRIPVGYCHTLPDLHMVDDHPILDAAVVRGEGWKVVA